MFPERFQNWTRIGNTSIHMFPYSFRKHVKHMFPYLWKHIWKHLAYSKIITFFVNISLHSMCTYVSRAFLETYVSYVSIIQETFWKQITLCFQNVSRIWKQAIWCCDQSWYLQEIVNISTIINTWQKQFQIYLTHHRV